MVLEIMATQENVDGPEANARGLHVSSHISQYLILRIRGVSWSGDPKYIFTTTGRRVEPSLGTQAR